MEVRFFMSEETVYRGTVVIRKRQPLGLPVGPRHGHTVGARGAFSYERGTHAHVATLSGPLSTHKKDRNRY